MASDTELKNYIEQKSKELYSDWECQIILPAFLGINFIKDCNVLHFVGDKSNKSLLSRVTFCNKKYHQHTSLCGPSFDLLYKDLLSASIDQGFKIIMNGNVTISYLGKKIIAKKFSCNRALC